MRLVIGLIGEQGAGKETVGNILLANISNIAAVHGCFGKAIGARHRFSDVLGETLDLWGVSRNRENLQNLAIAMRNTYGDGALTNAVKHRAMNAKENFVILDGVRWQTDFDMVRSLPKHFIIYVTADQRKRYERVIARKGAGTKVGEQAITFEEFCAAEQRPNETLIPSLGKQADAIIENNDDDSENPERPQLLWSKVSGLFYCTIAPRYWF